MYEKSRNSRFGFLIRNQVFCSVITGADPGDPSRGLPNVLGNPTCRANHGRPDHTSGGQSRDKKRRRSIEYWRCANRGGIGRQRRGTNRGGRRVNWRRGGVDRGSHGNHRGPDSDRRDRHGQGQAKAKPEPNASLRSRDSSKQNSNQQDCFFHTNYLTVLGQKSSPRKGVG
jgi:hypothetical protein